MQLDITDFFNAAAPMDYSASAAEIGQSAAHDTWQAALDDSEDYPLLTTDEQREEFRDYIKSTGGWSAEEIAAWSDTELNALCIQMIAGDIRESGLGPSSGLDAWEEYYANDQVSAVLTRGKDGQVYYYIGE